VRLCGTEADKHHVCELEMVDHRFDVARFSVMGTCFFQSVRVIKTLSFGDCSVRIEPAIRIRDPNGPSGISWAIALARNKALDRLRSSKRRDVVMKEYGETLEAGNASKPPVLA